ncbi:MAG: hypothetical protein AOA65_0086 [Candidatus Bathyarchaeota archaeon BA1]|nr:MAG: hypothetical protein AOA65_0086 [Candidatus Bathyarchaeota archaeon BA1]
MLLGNACEKGWLVIIKATDALLEGRGLGKGESYKDRRDTLWELSRKDEAIKALGLHDRFGAREAALHIHGFYDGMVGWELANEELEKVEKYVVFNLYAIHPTRECGSSCELIDKRSQAGNSSRNECL